ncbi:MAG: shikimate dehydrogenase [Dehalococcoidia bacterium]
MKHAGIIGFPVAHSLSPVFQMAAFRECGLGVDYLKWETPADLLAARVLRLREPDCLGANVTIPHKEAVIPLLDELGGQSARVGAVNTVVNRQGRLFGFNTDGPGFVSALRNECGFDAGGKRCLLLGAGGASRGIAFALAEARAAGITITNRTVDRAARLADAVASATGLEVMAGAAADVRQFDLVVNCTSVGMHGGPDPDGLAADPKGMGPGSLAVDIVYAPEETPFLRAAVAAGVRTLGGLPMLIYQGALAFELWTGVHAPVDVMFEAARKVLRERERARGGAS